ncbi:MAG TPA: acyl-CoA dehydrogenase family protein [Albitalea sp.]|uniref:acyl-CoA dehydrogenase family protein n=1 Tax=Piscinibacter sp. TaxID=1903157 RepID=UPI002ED4FED3
MSTEQGRMLADTLERLLRDHGRTQAALSEGWNDALWRQLAAMALPLLLVAEDEGGVGATLEDALPVALALGAHAVALPLGEALLARHAASRCGLALDDADSPVALATTAAGALEPVEGDVMRFTGSLHGVPWGHQLRQVLAVVEHADGLRLVALPVDAAQCRPGHNAAGEPRDRLQFVGVPAHTADCPGDLARDLIDLGALWRVGQMAGAMQAVLTRTVDHARDRVQFGKPIGSFQAVQQQLAVFGADAAAVACAAQAAFRSAARGEARFEIAAAKLRANLAVETATAVAHQVHGAIGFTREHDLRHFTQRLFAWRSEFGSDRHWSEALGQAVIARGVDSFWADLTARGDAAAIEAA